MAKITFRKVLKITGIILIILLVLILLALHFLMPFRESDEKMAKYFQEKQIEVIFHHEDYEGESVRFIEANLKNTPDSNLLVFVHGAPGSSSDMKAFLADTDLLTKTRMVSIDRLGYGYSNYGESEPNIAKQATFVHFIVNEFPHKKVILVGHSFGGPIVAKYAMDYPDLVDEVIMLAPLNEPESEPMFKIGYLAKWKATRWVLPKVIGVSADEKFAHAAELEKMRNDWQNIQVPLVHIHGTKDVLAPFSNVQFSKDNIPADMLKVLVLEDTNHFLPWTDYEVVKKVILEAFAE